MKYKILFLAVSTLSLLGCSGGGDDEMSMSSSSLPETYGDWTPSFSEQTSNFTQTRTGSQGSQQTRSITINSQSSTSTSTEEIINQDINDDDDLFDELEQLTTTYSASNGLGSFEVNSYSIIEDNDMGITIGNEFYPLSNGMISVNDYTKAFDDYQDDESAECYGNAIACDGFGLYDGALRLYSEGITYDPDDNYYNSYIGQGALVYFSLTSIFPSDIALANNETYRYYSLWDVYNEVFNENISYNTDATDCLNFPEDGYIESLLSNANQSGFNFCDGCALYELIYSTTDYMYYDELYDNMKYGETQAGGMDYCPGKVFDYQNNQNGQLSIKKSTDGIYTIKLVNAVNAYSLPIKVFYKGNIGIVN